MPNWVLIDATRKLIGDLPDTSEWDPDGEPGAYGAPVDEKGWNQEAYRCETGRCYAGWAAILAGATFKFDVSISSFVMIDHPTGGDHPSRRTSAYLVVEANGETWNVADYAEHALGITSVERIRLFAGRNTLRDLDAIIAEMRDEHGIVILDV